MIQIPLSRFIYHDGSSWRGSPLTQWIKYLLYLCISYQVSSVPLLVLLITLIHPLIVFTHISYLESYCAAPKVVKDLFRPMQHLHENGNVLIYQYHYWKVLNSPNVAEIWIEQSYNKQTLSIRHLAELHLMSRWTSIILTEMYSDEIYQILSLWTFFDTYMEV